MNNEKTAKIIPVGKLANHRYIIPIYQRNYAWTKTEVETLIDDIWDAYKQPKERYYIGTLVVAEREGGWLEVIDGQQRLTTLYLLLKAFGSPQNFELDFECRPQERKALQEPGSPHTKETVPAIYDAYEACMSRKEEICKNCKNNCGENKTCYLCYLKEKVFLVQAKLPPHIDLNHYFEIMNNRGLQLEKHEILKARFMEKLSEEEQKVFALIWDACSQMDGYVVQHFFRGEKDAAEKRKKLFGEGIPDCSNRFFEELLNFIRNTEQHENQTTNDTESKAPETWEEFKKKLLNSSSVISGQEKKNLAVEEPDEYQSIIRFPNFLLHVLRRVVENEKAVPLDDKQLLHAFEKSGIISSDGARTFALALLQCRLLFDHYVIKSHSENRWTLRKLAFDSKNKTYEIETFGKSDIQKDNVMIQSMFHVSFPQQNYKYWLDGLLAYLYRNKNDINGEDLLAHMERMCDHFFFQRISNKPKEYDDILKNIDSPPDPSEWQKKQKKQKKQEENEENEKNEKKNDLAEKYLHRGTNVPHFVFNRLDYILWKKKFQRTDTFYFTYRSSVEHFYPRNPNTRENINESNENNENEKILVDHFGNLCLISRSANSKFGNVFPSEKKRIAENSKDQAGLQSLKLRLMLERAEKWDKNTIIEHGKDMIKCLIEPLQPASNNGHARCTGMPAKALQAEDRSTSAQEAPCPNGRNGWQSSEQEPR